MPREADKDKHVGDELRESASRLSALQYSEQKYRMLVEQSSDGIHTYDLNGNFIEVNARLCEMLGYAREELLRLNVCDLVSPDELSTSPIRFDELRDGKRIISERRLRRRDGTLLPVEISGTRLPDGTLQASIRDITERKRAEEKLRHSEEWLRAILLASRDGILVEKDEVIVFANESYVRLLGYERCEDLVGCHVSVVLSPQDGMRLLEFGRRRVRGEAMPSVYEFEGRHRDGSCIALEASVSTHRIAGETYITTAVRGIAERRRAEESLRRAHDELERRVAERTAELGRANEILQAQVAERRELLGRLVTSLEEERRRISLELHDQVGQHLTAIMLAIQSLKLSPKREATTQDQVVRLQELTDQLEQKVRTLAWELRPASLDDLGLQTTLSNFVEEWSEHSRVAVDFHSIGLEAERLPTNIETALYRIAQEAFANVIKHARASRVTLLLERRADHVLAIIEDDGCGFDVEKVMGAPVRERRMGLLGMQERIALVGGTLNIESTPSLGTTVFVRAPVSNNNGQGGDDHHG